MRKYTFYLCLLMSLFSINSLLAQENTEQKDTIFWQIETTDNNIYVGEKIDETAEYVELKTESLGTIRIQKSRIMLMRTVKREEIDNIGRKRNDNTAQLTRYFFSPNAYNLKKGEGYYQNSWIFYNQVSYGVTDQFSIGGGLVPTFLFGAPTPVWITPKFSLPIAADKVNISIGALTGGVVGDIGGGSLFGILYGNSTFGSLDQNISVNIGYGFANEGIGTQTPVFSISGITKVGRRSHLITENYVFTSPDGNVTMISGGGRWTGDRIGIDYGLFVPIIEEFGVVAFPWLSLTVPFGQN